MESLANFDLYWLALAVKLVVMVGFFLTVPLVAGYIEHKVTRAPCRTAWARWRPASARSSTASAAGRRRDKFIQKEDIIPARRGQVGVLASRPVSRWCPRWS